MQYQLLHTNKSPHTNIPYPKYKTVTAERTITLRAKPLRMKCTDFGLIQVYDDDKKNAQSHKES